MKKKILLMVISLCFYAPGAWAKISVVTSFSILADMARQIGGDKVEVKSLVGINQDAHVYQPSPGDVKQLSGAKVFIVNGLGFEGWMNRLVTSSSFKGQVIVATHGIEPIKEHEGHSHDSHGDHEHGNIDPHAWQDPVLAQIYVKNITAGLIKADPEGKVYYQQRAEQYGKQLTALHRWAQQAFNRISAAQRKVLTTHDAFAYLGRRYRVQFMSIQGISTEAEASAKVVATLIRQVKQNNVKAVFLENIADARLISQLANEAGVKIQGRLYTDALSSGNELASSYLNMMRANITTLTRAMKP